MKESTKDRIVIGAMGCATVFLLVGAALQFAGLVWRAANTEAEAKMRPDASVVVAAPDATAVRQFVVGEEVASARVWTTKIGVGANEELDGELVFAANGKSVLRIRPDNRCFVLDREVACEDAGSLIDGFRRWLQSYSPSIGPVYTGCICPGHPHFTEACKEAK